MATAWCTVVIGYAYRGNSARGRIGRWQLLREVLPALEQLGWVRCYRNDQELVSVDAFIPPADDLIAEASTMLDIVMATPVQRAALAHPARPRCSPWKSRRRFNTQPGLEMRRRVRLCATWYRSSWCAVPRATMAEQLYSTQMYGYPEMISFVRGPAGRGCRSQGARRGTAGGGQPLTGHP